MSCKVTSVYIKPTNEVVWHAPLTLTPSLDMKYGEKRWILSVKDEENTLTVEVVWETKQVLEEFMQEPEIVEQMAKMKAYHEEHGIITVSKDITESDKSFLEYLTEG
jgi:hypothetical protein